MNAPDKPFPFDQAVAAAADRIEPKVIAWRRDIHENPELGNREFRTSGIVAEHLNKLGLDEIRTLIDELETDTLVRKVGSQLPLRVTMSTLQEPSNGAADADVAAEIAEIATAAATVTTRKG